MLKDFIEKANYVHNNFYDYSLVEYKNNKSKIKIICPIHGIFEKTPLNHTQGQGCKKCSLEKTSTKFRKLENIILDQFLTVHDNKYDYSLVQYINTNSKIKIICNKHGIFEQTPKNHINGHGCPYCATENKAQKFKKNNQEFINVCLSKHNGFYNYSKTNYINNRTDIIVICPIHCEFNINPSHHLNGVGCSKCAGNYKNTTEEFIIKAKNIHNNKYCYNLLDYKNNKTKIKIICSKHGIFEQNPSHHLFGCGCPKCNSSKGENEIRKYLEKYNFIFKEQKRFDKCKNKKTLPFDFYLIEYNICIEYDGLHHYEPIRGEKSLEIVKLHDKIKTKFCTDNNITLIRIPYTENNIENIIKTINN